MMPSERVQQHLDRLEKMRAKLDTILDTVPEHLWDTKLYSDGAQWTLRQLVIHLMISDRGQNSIVKGVVGGKEVIPADYDLERFNKSSVQKQAETSVPDARASLKVTRADLVNWLKDVEDEALDKQGRHATLKVLTVGQMLNVMAMHESAHADDIERFVKENA
jgi:hypothetical protein